MMTLWTSYVAWVGDEHAAIALVGMALSLLFFTAVEVGLRWRAWRRWRRYQRVVRAPGPRSARRWVG